MRTVHCSWTVWIAWHVVSADPLHRPPPSASSEKASFHQARKTNHRFLDLKQMANYTEPKCPLGEISVPGGVRCATPADFAEDVMESTLTSGHSNITNGIASGNGVLSSPLAGLTQGKGKAQQKLDALDDLSEVRKRVLKSTAGKIIDYHFLRFVTDRKRLRAKNPCFAHVKEDGFEGVFCMPAFYIMGPQKCGTTDTFERTMRHPDVVSLNPKHGEMLEPHLWTNQIEDFTKTRSLKTRPTPLLFQYSLKQFTRHRAEMLGSLRRIAGDASADLMYRVAVKNLPTAQLVHAVQPDAKFIAVLRDPVERTYSDFRFFFHCGINLGSYNDRFDKCPKWWPLPHVADLKNPARRFHEVVEREISEFKHCLTDHVPKTMRKQLFGEDMKTIHPKAPPKANRRRLSRNADRRSSSAQANNHSTTSSGSSSSSISSSSSSSSSAGGEGVGLLYADPVRLNMCRQREDFNRDAAINKCYSGRVVLSVYAAFLVEWLAHFPGDQLLALPLEGLDKTPRAWLGGIYAFLGLRPPKEEEWRVIAPGTTPLSDFSPKSDVEMSIVRKTEPTLQCGRNHLVKFGPLHPATKLLLQRFFAPWNDELRRLLEAKGVATVPGYGFTPDANPILPPKGAIGKRAPRQQGVARAQQAAAAKAKDTIGFWWWPYDELELAKHGGGKSSSSSSSASASSNRKPSTTPVPPPPPAPPPPVIPAVPPRAARAANGRREASLSTASNQASSVGLGTNSSPEQSTPTEAPLETAPETSTFPSTSEEESLPLTKSIRKKSKNKSLLSGFGTGKVLKPVPRKVVRRETLIEFSKPPAPGYEEDSSSSSTAPESKTVKVLKQGQGHFSSTSMHMDKN